MAISSGSFSVGVSGDYSTWAGFWADVAATLTGNLTGTQISDITDNTAIVKTTALAGYTLAVTSNKEHNGNFQGGWKSTMSMNLSSAVMWDLAPTSLVAGAVLSISKLNFINTGTITTYGLALNILTTSNTTAKINNVLYDGNSKLIHAFRTQYSSTLLEMYNCVVTRCRYGFAFVDISASSVVENCIAYANISEPAVSYGFGNIADRAYTLRNCISASNSKQYVAGATPSTGLGNTNAISCASSDSSSSKTVVSDMVAANEFVSISILTLGFLQLKPTSVLNFMGVAPTISGNTTGIRGNARPAQANVWSIGADEQGSAIASLKYTVGTGGDYSTWAAFASALPASFVQDITGEQISDVTETVAFTMNNALNGCSCTMDNRLPHSGRFLSGHRTTLSMNLSTAFAWILTNSSTVAGARMRLLNLNLIYTGTVTTRAYGISLNSATANITNILDNMIMDANNRIFTCVYSTNATTLSNISNSVFREWERRCPS